MSTRIIASANVMEISQARTTWLGRAPTAASAITAFSATWSIWALTSGRTVIGYLILGSRIGSGQTLVQVLGEPLPHCGCLPVSLVWLSHGMRLAGHRARSGWKGHAPNLVRVQVDPELVVMSMLVDRRDELGRARTQTVNRLHRLLLELFPGGAKKFLSATQARALVATTRPRDIVGKTRRRLTVELITELETIDKKIKPRTKTFATWSLPVDPPCWTCMASVLPARLGC